MPKHRNRAMHIRQLTGMPQWETASMLDTSREAIALYETGKRSGLPTQPLLYKTFIELEMAKPENVAAAEPVKLTEKGRQLFAKKLERLAKNSRVDALLTERKMEACQQKLEQARQRKLLLHCCEKAQAYLVEQNKISGWRPITPHQQQWLEQAKKYHGFSGVHDALFMELQLLELKHRRLLHEAESAEALLAALVVEPPV